MAARSNPSPHDLLSLGSRLGGVRIDRLLTRGAMGALYLAFDESDGAPLVVKAVPLGQPGDPALTAAEASFQREVSQAAQLRHPGIVTTYGAIVQGGMGYLAMELLAGTDGFLPFRLAMIRSSLFLQACTRRTLDARREQQGG